MTAENPIDVSSPEYYHNRELSWLDFNRRVLAEATDPLNPLLERLNFLSIVSSNLDEFFMVRVAGLQDQVKMNFTKPENKTQMTPLEQLDAIAQKAKEDVVLQYKIYRDFSDELKNLPVHFKRMDQLNEYEQRTVKAIFDELIFPVLTPLKIDAYRPTPNINEKLINIFVHLEKDGISRFAIVPLPALADRFVLIENEVSEKIVLYTEDIITYFIKSLFNGYQVKSSFNFRITINADLELHEEGAEDLLAVIEDYLVQRKHGVAVRLEVDARKITPGVKNGITYLQKILELQERDVYLIQGPLDLTILSKISKVLAKTFPTLVYDSFKPAKSLETKAGSLLSRIEKEDLFFHHPYDSFEPIVAFIKEAANDPHVLAIKQTLYRVSNDSPIVRALIQAAENGKQVTVLVELKARFDEENNVQWAKELEEAGCHVLYGMTHLKTHSKITLVVKKYKNKITRYIHLGTGNYNDSTAKLYTDMGILTANKEIGEDATNFFNYLSGYSIRPTYAHLHVSPFDIRDSFVEDIEEEIKAHEKYGNGHIVAKMNSLTDKDVIMKLYEASQAGVKIVLIVRGICCLRPQIPGVSENIHVHSIIGRFLEHSRIYYFYHNGTKKLYLSSADMMTRNMIKRIEIEFPILDNRIKREILKILDIMMRDNVKAWEQTAEGTYQKIRNSAPKINSQQVLMDNVKTENKKQTEASWLKQLTKRLKLS